MTALIPERHETIAAEFIQARSISGATLSGIGQLQFDQGSRVIDLGCGHGDPNMPLLLGRA